jgi:hypothetical protein
LGIEALLPPHHEVGAPGTERCHDNRHSKSGSSTAHRDTSPMSIIASIAPFLDGGNAIQPGFQGCIARLAGATMPLR